MTDEHAMLAAIDKSPGDDTPRQALADWLDEHDRPVDACEQRLAVALRRVLATPEDDAPRLDYARVCRDAGRHDRAEFIEVQCELARRRANWPEAREEIRQRAALRQLSDAGAAILLAVAEVQPDSLQRRERELFAAAGPGQVEWFGGAHPLPLIGTDVASLLPWFSRGFVDRVTCSAEGWLAHAEAAFWHPEQTVACPGPKPHHAYYCRPEHDSNCPGGCRGAGRVPRPFVPTAQPIREATLTTVPAAHVHEFNALRRWVKPLEWGGDVRDSFAAEWPGITFTLPPEPVRRGRSGIQAAPVLGRGAGARTS